MAANEENQKYIAKLLENPRLILFFFPNYAKNKLSGVAKCFNSINPFVDNEEFKDLSDDEDDTETAKKNKTPKIISVCIYKKSIKDYYSIVFLNFP